MVVFPQDSEALFHQKLVAILQAEYVQRSPEGKIARLRELETAFPDAVETVDVRAFFYFAVANYWAAAAAAADRLLRGASAQIEALLDHCARGLDDRSRVEALCRDGSDEFCRAMLAEMQAAFARGDFATADDALQVVNAIRWPFVTPHATVAELRRQGVGGGGPKRIEVTTQSQFEASAGFVEQYDTPEEMNRRRLADLVAEAVTAEAPHCLEIGCYSAAQLRAVAKALEQRGRQPVLYGLEPVASAVSYVSEHFSHITMFEADIAALSGGRFDARLPELLDVVVLSAVCQAIDEAEMDGLLAWCRRRVAMLAIADDVMNLDGDFCLARNLTHLHPYRKLFQAHGFELTHVSPVPDPGRNYTGFILATATRQTSR